MTLSDSTSKHADDPVLKLITSPIPKILWHYTDFEGFRGIVNSKRIHATNLKYLNDKEEFEHAFLLSKQLLLDLLPIEDADPPVVRPLVIGSFEHIFTKGILCPSNLSLFTASFTLHGDQLSQWRGYSRGSTGVSLGFDFSDVRTFTAPASPVVFAPCVYSDDDKERLLRNLITSYMKPTLKSAMEIADIPTVMRSLDEIAKTRPDQSMEQIQSNYFDQALKHAQEQVPQTVNELAIKLFHVMALLKHSAFEEEQEWRYVFPVFAKMPNPPELKFRARPGALVPYIEFPLIGDEPNKNFLLKEIILGPGSEDALAINSTRAFLDSVGLKDVSISRSRVPYRPW
jgi:hypothetical protein